MIKLTVIALIFYSLNIIIGSVQAKSVENRGASFAECLKDPSSAKTCEALLPFAKSADIKAFMRPDLDPCEDFYEYACGEWSHVNRALTKSTTGFFEKLAHGMSLKVSAVLEGTVHANDTENDKKVKRFYSSCIKLYDIPLVEHLSSFKKIIAEFGTMPALSANWSADSFDWLETLGKIQYKYGIQSIIGADIIADFKDNSRNRIYFGQSELPLQSKSMYINAETAKYRTMYATKIASQLQKYLQLKYNKAQEVAQSIVDFEQQLAAGMLDDGVSRSLDETAKLITSEQMSTKYAPTLNISRFLEFALGEPITDSIYDCGQEFQIHLTKVISSVSKETLANYIFYQLVSEFFPKVAMDEKSQHKLCAEVVKAHFSKLLDNMIYRQFKQKDSENDINAAWLKIKAAFNKELSSKELEWISPHVREAARKKLYAMKLEINSYVNTNFTDEMKDLNITNLYFIENVKSIHQNNVRRLLKKLHEPPTPFEAAEELSYTPVNIILENAIKIPVSLLQPYYLWSKAYPEAIMYGTLGFLIGHELIHGFDDNGREYDEIGNQSDWWDERSTAAFINRTECFIDQYSKYVFGDKQLTRMESQAENIADNGGLRIAYKAYQNWLETNGVDRQLPLFDNITTNQLFFISYAQVWCSDTEPGLRLLQAATDEHTPSKFRVIGVLTNSDEFSKEFNCKAGTKMNPINKCVIY